ncbi:MAG TPA: 3D domain-containing protein [Gemmatimonadaceae bacterium]
MRRLARLPARLLLPVICCGICGAVGVASGADTPSHGQSAAALRHANSTITQRIHSATLDLYSLDAQLRRARAQLASLTAQHERIARERASVRLRIAVSRANARIANRRLETIVRNLYEQQQSSDPLAVVLGARSLDDAIASLDDLSRSAQTNQQVVTVSRHAKQSLATLRRRLAAEDAHVRALEAAAANTEATLTASISARSRFVSRLASQRSFNTTQLARISAVARASAASSPSAPSAPATAPAVVVSGARTITVTATAYSMGGTTATGLPVGWGTVAVDPSVIPLGTRLTIPGYGSGVAADTGSAVSGATIDLWFPTVQQAQAWGRRVVVVTLSP